MCKMFNKKKNKYLEQTIEAIQIINKRKGL